MGKIADSLNNFYKIAVKPIRDLLGGHSVEADVPSDAKFTDTVYTHPTTAGNKHIPSGGSAGKFLGWSADGEAQWVDDPTGGLSLGYNSIIDGAEIALLLNNEEIGAQPISGNNGIAVSSGAGYIIIEPELKSTSKATYESGTPSNTSGRQYPVVPDKNGKLSVNVPWEDNDSHHTAYIYAGGSSSAANASQSSNPYLNLVENGSRRSGVQLYSASSAKLNIKSDANGKVTFDVKDQKGKYCPFSNTQVSYSQQQLSSSTWTDITISEYVGSMITPSFSAAAFLVVGYEKTQSSGKRYFAATLVFSAEADTGSASTQPSNLCGSGYAGENTSYAMIGKAASSYIYGSIRSYTNSSCKLSLAASSSNVYVLAVYNVTT